MADRDSEASKKQQETEEAVLAADIGGFDDSERLTLKINVAEANRYQAEKNKKKDGKYPKKALKKRKKTINTNEDDDEDEMDEDVLRSLRELQINQQDASNADNSLINALFPEERKQIMQSTNIEVVRHEENAGRQNALEQADTLLRKANLSKMNTQEFMNEMKDAIYNPSRLRRQAMEDGIAKQMGISGEIRKHNEGNVVKGVLQVQKVGENRQVPVMNMEDVQKVGEKRMSQNETAELILRKSGQTARLSEIKKQGYSKPAAKNKKMPNKSYAKQMKEILRESLKKNNKVR